MKLIAIFIFIDNAKPNGVRRFQWAFTYKIQNPTENIWGMITRTVRNRLDSYRNHRTRNELTAIATEEASDILKKKIIHYINVKTVICVSKKWENASRY